MTACFSVLSDANGSGSLFIDWNNRVNEVGLLSAIIIIIITILHLYGEACDHEL